MVGRERREPVNSEVMDPHHKNGDVDGQHPEHEDENRVCIVVKIIVGARSLRMSAPMTACI